MGGTAAKKARIEVEKQTGESLLVPKNAKSLIMTEKKSLSDKGNK